MRREAWKIQAFNGGLNRWPHNAGTTLQPTELYGHRWWELAICAWSNLSKTNESMDEMVYEINHILNCGYEIKWSYDPRSYEY